LWKRLEREFASEDSEVAAVLAANLVTICDAELSPRLKAIPTLMPEYTLHDDVHALRVTEIMWRVMPDRVRTALNPVEIALLILAAYVHDQGMVMDPGELALLPSNSDFKLFRENWEVEHLNVADIRQRVDDATLTPDERARAQSIEQELHGAMLTDFIRVTHGERSARFVKATYESDKRLLVRGTSLAEFVARLSASHVEPPERLTPANGFRFDERIGTYAVNMAYLGSVLRLADIMDFDRERTPDSLYRTIDFRSGVSLREWNKHRSVDGWVIKPDKVQFTLRCEHPEYQRAVYQFMDWIDQELAAARDLTASFPEPFALYAFELPLRVDRSRMEPKDGAYIYRDLEFSLSRDEIVSLLMTEELYGGPRLCVRELLQNALDALRHRRAVMRRDGVVFADGRVDFWHELDEDGFEILRCTDNGIGMTEDVIARFLTRAGRSYYRSPEFERERASFRSVGADFDPCAQFGIGFMSVFMIGDEIEIRTRRDHGRGLGYGEPLVVRISGLGGMVVIRKGDPSQKPGTSVEIRGRTRASIINEWDDKVQLIQMLDGYALATEFPIRGECTIPEIAGATVIPIDFAVPPTDLENAGVPDIRTFEARFDSISPDLNGIVRVSFIIDDRKRLTHEHAGKKWQNDPENANPRRWRLLVNDRAVDRSLDLGQVCVDGILVCGEPGRADKDSDSRMLGHRVSRIGFGRATFLLDARGPLKPALTPSRQAPDFFLSGPPSWRRLQKIAGDAWGKIWEEIADLAPVGIDDETFWVLAEIYGAGILDMRASSLWSKINVPVFQDDQTLSHVPLDQLGPLRITKNKTGFDVDTLHGRVRLPDKSVVPHFLHGAIIASSRVSLKESGCVFEASDISKTVSQLRDRLIRRDFDGPIYKVPYSSDLGTVLTISGAVPTVNADHAMVQAIKIDSVATSPLDRFISAFLNLIVDSTVQTWLSGTEPVEEWVRRVGKLFVGVDWNAVNASLRPPYTLFLDGSEVRISASDLENWAAGKR
jgi:Molecular chaperone, HSP90 family